MLGSMIADNGAIDIAVIARLVNGAPAALDTLEELADALGDDANYAATITTALALKAPLASPALTGNPTVPTQTPGNNSTRAASTAYTDAAVAAGLVTAEAYADAGLALKAALASPTFTGTPAVPTAAVDTNTTQVASTAFVLAQASAAAPLIDGAATVGTSTRYAREGHVHPTDTSRAPLASPSFTGTVSAPSFGVTGNQIIDGGTLGGSTPASVVWQRIGAQYFAIGAGVPTSVDLPVGAYYFDSSNILHYIKYGAAAGNWQNVVLLNQAGVAFAGISCNTNALITNAGFKRGARLAVSLSADQNDYNPTNLSTCGVLVITNTAGANINITGLQGGADLREILLINASTGGVADTITLKHASGSSSAANQFQGEGAAASLGGDVLLYAGRAAMLYYDGAITKYRAFGL